MNRHRTWVRARIDRIVHCPSDDMHCVDAVPFRNAAFLWLFPVIQLKTVSEFLMISVLQDSIVPAIEQISMIRPDNNRSK